MPGGRREEGRVGKNLCALFVASFFDSETATETHVVTRNITQCKNTRGGLVLTGTHSSILEALLIQ